MREKIIILADPEVGKFQSNNFQFSFFSHTWFPLKKLEHWLPHVASAREEDDVAAPADVVAATAVALMDEDDDVDAATAAAAADVTSATDVD